MALQFDRLITRANLIDLEQVEAGLCAIGIIGGRVAYVGPSDDVRLHSGARTVVHDLDGAYVTPGMVDVHTHLATDSMDVGQIECRDFYDSSVTSVADILRRIEEGAAVTHRDQAVVVGRGSPMQAERLAERRLPCRQELDKVVGDRPCYVTFGAHVMSANSKALGLGGISATTPDPQGGIIERDANGEPNGILRERAQWLVIKGSPLSYSRYRAAIESELHTAASHGVTTILDIVRKPVELEIYQELAEQNRLPVRVFLIVRVIESEFDQWSLHDLALRQNFGSDRLRLAGIKMSIDGGFTARQGYFYPRSDDLAENHPLIRITQEELDETTIRYGRRGMRICTHAIGDAAADMALTSFQRLTEEVPTTSNRHRIEHLGNWLFGDDRRRATRELGIVPVPNPSIVYYLADAGFQTLGAERMSHSLPLRTMLDEGWHFYSASDGPNYWPIDPLRDVRFAVDRQPLRGGVLHPEEAIDPIEAFRGITRHAAWLGFAEDFLGRISPGYACDLTVFDRDPLSSLSNAKVLGTFMNGAPVSGPFAQ